MWRTQSTNCRNEVNFALGKDISILTVHFKKTELPGGLSLNLSARQAILKHDMPEKEYRHKLMNRIATYLKLSSPPAIKLRIGFNRFLQIDLPDSIITTLTGISEKLLFSSLEKMFTCCS